MLINLLGNRLGETLRFIANTCCLLLFILWGAFFIEHLSWFGSEPTPPTEVWLLQLVHLLMLIGLLVALKWKKIGSGMIIGSALIFFSQTAGQYFLPFFLVTIIPAVLFLISWWLENHRMQKTHI